MATLTKTLRQLFGLNSDEEIEIGSSAPMYAVTPIDGYTWPKTPTLDILIFWRLNMRACMLSGDKGCGKTSLVEQLHHRLQLNLQTMTGNGKTTLEALFGQYIPTEQGTLVWQDGPVTSAARNGHSVLINEFNAIPEDIQLSLMDAIHEGCAFSIPEKGEQFMPADGFRLFATINPKGLNDYMYRGRKDLDAALKERFFWINVPYMSMEEEKAALMNLWSQLVEDEPAFYEQYVDQMLQVAHEVRRMSKSTGEDAIPEIISTRVLVNWSIYWTQYESEEGAVHLSLQRALTFGCSPPVQYQIHKIVDMKTSIPSPYSLSTVI